MTSSTFDIRIHRPIKKMHKPVSRPCLPRPRLLTAALVIPLLLGGCASFSPEALNSEEIHNTSRADREFSQRDMEPLNGPLTLEEAIARAVKYNLDRRVRILEEAVAQGQLDVGSFETLPKLVASAGYRDRNKDLITRSKDSVTGLPSLSHPYISSDRAASTTDLSFTWSLLDFGQSYYATRQNADRVMIAAERRRKALHILIQDVRSAFWRAAGAQRLKARVQETIAEAEGALTDSRQAEAERLRNPLDSLRYQRQLLENLRLLEAIDQELSTARVELASLTNTPLSHELQIAEPESLPSIKWMDVPIEAMEEQAILQNADLRESFYNARIARDETRRAMLKLFPGLSFSYATHHSSDTYLINQRWNESGLQVSLNLFGLLAAPAQKRLAEAGVAAADQRRMATQMAILTQLHIARLQYANAYRQYERANDISKVDMEISEHMLRREQAQTQTKLDRVANQTSSILSQLRRYQALAQFNTAASKLQATLGLEPALDGGQNRPLQELTQVVSASLQEWEAAKLKTPATTEKGD